MSFKSLFGLSHLLKCYGIRSEGLMLNDKAELSALTPPFLAQTVEGPMVIVRSVTPDTVEFDLRGTVSTLPVRDFADRWTGNVFLAFPDEASREPDYGSHYLTEVVSRLSKYALAAAALAVFVYFFITRGVYAHVSTVLLTLLNCAGLYLSYMLLQKSLNIHTRTSDRVCGVLEQGGCDSIVSMKVSKLFGVFSWSEVGFGYFGVSLVTLLIFPHLWPSLAICNACCLPYTVWSIWYQKFPRPPLVHALRRSAVDALAAVFLLPRRRLVPPRLSAPSGLLHPDCCLRLRRPVPEYDYTHFQKSALP